MNLLQRIKLDWQEWRDDQRMQWLKRRDIRNVNRTIKQAKLSHEQTGQTMYVLRMANNNPFVVRSKDVEYYKQQGWIPKEVTAYNIFTKCICYVNARGVHFVKDKKK